MLTRGTGGYTMWPEQVNCLRVPAAPVRTGASCVTGAVRLVPSRPDGYLTTRESAVLIGVSRETISSWRRLGILATQGLDERGYPLHTPDAVRDAERRVRENGLAKGGYDPRRLRSAATRIASHAAAA
jgi:hypothetical protein